MKTKSLWGSPPSRYYSLLRFLDKTLEPSQRNIAVLGCADGKYVLPAARRGYKVYAVDIDGVQLFGGTKVDSSGEVAVEGLTRRLAKEGLTSSVTIAHGDFTVKPPSTEFPVVLTSGSIQYSFNAPKTADEMLRAVLSFAAGQGYVYVDYMLPWEDKYKGRANCPTAAWWREYTSRLTGWKVVHHRTGPPVLDRAHIEFPVDHHHQWGHLLLQRRS